MMRHRNDQKSLLLLTMLIMFVFSFLGSANAVEFDLGPDTKLDCLVTVTYGVGVRTSDRDEDLLLGAINTDDGDRNFDQWDLMNNKVTTFADIEFTHKNFGLFIRPKAFYDHVYMTNNSNNSPETNNSLAGGLINSSDEWPDKVEDIHGMNAEILDLFAFTDFQLFDRYFDFRVGKQVIAWGESLLIPGGISSAQSPMDYSAATAVGTEVKEVYLPTESAYLQVSITQELGLDTYYQWKWEKNRYFESGTFFSPVDMYDEVRAPLLTELGSDLLIIPRGEDQEARDDGQYGISLRYLFPWVNSTEIGAYFINYHDKSPLLLIKDPSLALTGGASYYLAYVEDIKLYGLSVSSLIGTTSVAGEFSYRQDVGFLGSSDEGYPSIEKGDFWQARTAFTHQHRLRFFAEEVSLVGEIACGKEVDRKENQFAWTYSAKAIFSWIQVLPMLDVNFDLSFADTPEGSNLLGQEDFSDASTTIGVVYRNRLKCSITYENRFNDHVYQDRDTLSFKASYSF